MRKDSEWRGVKKEELASHSAVAMARLGATSDLINGPVIGASKLTQVKLLPLIIVILLKTISQLLYVIVEIIISRENSQSARIIQGTLGRL